MLSSIETQLGLTVIGPAGQALRISRTSPAYRSGKELMQQSLPAEQLWGKLKSLMADPMQSLRAWCARFGIKASVDSETIRLQDFALPKAYWYPLIQRSMLVGASPAPALRLAETLGSTACAADVSKLCLHWQEIAPGTHRLGIIRPEWLPAEAKIGDRVISSGKGDSLGLVSHDVFDVATDGILTTLEGMVLVKPGMDQATADELLAEPVILGFNRTYRCEEGSADGWLDDMSFDSLKAARLNADEIRKSGSEVRIINRITGDEVSLT